MSSQPTTFSGSETPASALGRVRKLLPLSHITGVLGAVLFFLTLLSLGDALQALMRQEFNRIDIIAGEETLVSGQLPANTASHAEIKVSITGDEALLFAPLETYRGFWLGGNMWRATIAAGTDIRSSKAVLTIIDFVPREGSNEEAQDLVQNSSLVYPLYLWASAQEKDRASSSVFQRFFGLNSFILAGLSAICALLVTFANSLIVRDIETKLGKASIYRVHGRKQEKSGYVVSFPSSFTALPLDTQVYLYDRQWRMQASGEIVEADPQITKAVVPLTSSPQFGWFISAHKM